jgi:hypothetical protein
VILAVCLLLGTPAMAQPGGRGFGGGGFPNFGTSFYDLARNEDVQAELNLSAEQVQQIDEISVALRRIIEEGFDGLELKDKPWEERERIIAEYRERVETARADADMKVGKLLDPQQYKRLKQIQYQSRLRVGIGVALSRGELASELEVTEEQKDRLLEVRAETDRELREKIEQLRKEAEDKILAVLSTEQQARFKDLVGEPFEFRRGGRGGPGRDGERGRFEDRGREGDRNREGNRGRDGDRVRDGDRGPNDGDRGPEQGPRRDADR